jgi:hypothetical protein
MRHPAVTAAGHANETLTPGVRVLPVHPDEEVEASR